MDHPVQLVPSAAKFSTGTDLPTEIFLQIFEYLHYSANLSFQTVCRSWNRTATLLLYKDVVVRNDTAIRKFVRTLEASDGLSAVVGALSLGGRLKEASAWSFGTWVRPVWEGEWEAGFRAWDWAVVLSTVLARCVNLRALELHTLYGASVATIPTLDAHAFSRLEKLRITQPRYSQWANANLSKESVSQVPHWLTDGMSTNTPAVDFASLTHLTIKAARNLRKNTTWVPLAALCTLVLHELDISDVSLAALLTSAGATLEDITYSSVMVTYTPDMQPAHWPPTLPRVRRLAILHTGIVRRATPGILLEPCAQTLHVLELKLSWKNTYIDKTNPPTWPALPALHTFAICDDPTLAIPLVPRFGRSFRTLDMAGDRMNMQLHDAASLQILTALKDTLTSLTLRNFDFRQTSVREFLPSLHAVQTFAVHPEYKTLPFGFHASLPPNLRVFRLLSYLNKGQFEALNDMLRVDMLCVHYPLLKTVEVQGGLEEWDIQRQEILRKGFSKLDITLHVRLWGSAYT